MNPERSERIEIPVLPLRDVVVYPHMVIPLFVGREKSIRCLEAAMDHDKKIMLVAQKEELWPTEAEVDDELAHWDAKRDGEHTFASNDRRRAAQRIASSHAAAFILAHSTLTPPPAEATVLKAENR